MEERPEFLRQKIVYISPTSLSFGFHKGAYRVFEKELPEGAKIVSSGYAENRNMFYIVYEHPSFEEVRIGDELPFLEGPVFTRLYPGEIV